MLAVRLPLLNMGARGLGLAGRLGLTIYMAHYLPLQQVGVFGLITGVAGLMPAVSGLGLNFFLTRQLVDQQPTAAGVLIRDRLAVTVLMMSLFAGAALLAGKVGVIALPPLFLVVIPLVFMDTIAFDLHMSLISLRKPLLANMLLFLRSAAWIFPAVLVGVLDPRHRTLDVLLYAWLGGLVLYFACLALAFRDWPLREIARVPVDWLTMRATALGGWLIYINDIGIAGTLYLDRFVIERMMGLADTGIYTLYWSIANGVYVLVTAAVSQIAIPHLVAAFRSHEAEWLRVLERQIVKILSIGVPICALIFAITELLLPRFGVERLATRPVLFLAMLAGILMRLLSDMINNGLYSRGLDRQLALINIGGLGLAVVMDVSLIWLVGLNGVGVSMIVTPGALMAARIWVLWRAGAPLPFLTRERAVEAVS